MFDFNKWVYSEDIAKWLADRKGISAEDQINCILSAPHRTLEEKLEGMKELSESVGDGRTAGYIRTMEDLIKQADSDDMTGNCWYRVEIYNRGEMVTDLPVFRDGLFRNLKSAREEVRSRIQDQAYLRDDAEKAFYGVIQEYAPCQQLERMEIRRQYIINFEGKIIYFLLGAGESRESPDGCGVNEIGPRRGFPFEKIPYRSGTLVEIPVNPFFPSAKGVIANETEPGEPGFLETKGAQWVICPDIYKEQTKGIKLIDLDERFICDLLDKGTEFPVPCLNYIFFQFLKKYEGNLQENEQWLFEVSKLVGKNRECVRMILKDRQPGANKPNSEEGSDEKRLKYIKQLSERSA